MKNIALSLPAADYYGHSRETKLHAHHFFKDLQSFIAGMWQRFPIDLGIIVGHPAMIHRGPIGGKNIRSRFGNCQSGFLWPRTPSAPVLGIETVEHVVQAARLGLGKSSMDNINIVGASLDEAIRIFKNRSADKQLEVPVRS